MTSEDRVRFHILENALDYVLSAAEYGKISLTAQLEIFTTSLISRYRATS